MFKLSAFQKIEKSILSCDYNRYLLESLIQTDTVFIQVLIDKAGEDSVISIIDSFLKLNFDVVIAADNRAYTADNDINLVDIGP